MTRIDRGTEVELRLRYGETSQELTAAMAMELRNHLHNIATQHPRVSCLLLRGEPDADFCPASHTTAAALIGECAAIIHALTSPVIAAVEKSCAGTAIALLLACDTVILTDEAVLAVRPGDIDETTAAALAERAGRVTAASMALIGKPLTGIEAERAGVARYCVSPHAFEAAVGFFTTALSTANWQTRTSIQAITSPHACGEEQ